MEHNNNNTKNRRRPSGDDSRPGKNRRPGKPAFDKKNAAQGKPAFDKKSASQGKPTFGKKGSDKSSDSRPEREYNRPARPSRFSKTPKAAPGRKAAAPSEKKPASAPKSNKDTIRLNKFIANAGICSRREADNLIAAGSISVNGKVVTEMGFQVHEGDVVNYGGETLRSERKRYFLLNKPKGYITTLDDPQERQTVMMLIDSACPERIYPVGRLDRNTTGLLLFTNDGDLARRLTHPSTGVYKIYQVELDKRAGKGASCDLSARLSALSAALCIFHIDQGRAGDQSGHHALF